MQQGNETVHLRIYANGEDLKEKKCFRYWGVNMAANRNTGAEVNQGREES